MAKNDTLLLDGIIDDRVELRLPSDKRDEAFEYLAFEQILKDFDLVTEEILSGAIDGRQDGGIDGFFILVNGHLLQDAESFSWPRTGADLRLHLVTAKHHDAFRQGTLDAVIATLTEVLDFAKDDSELTGAYSEALLRMRSNLRYAYRKLSPRLSSFAVSVTYASRGDTSQIGKEVQARADQIAKLIRDYFGSCSVHCGFIGAAELIALHRRAPTYSLELPFVEALSKGERYVLLARLTDYFAFVTEDGRLRRYLFESNVRDFMGLNRVNEDIKATLADTGSPDFWWLNNGVTILATAAAITGKSIQVSDIQIVNGLQTTESIFRHYSGRSDGQDDRCVLVKVIVSTDDAVRDAIIRATNNQTDVELSSLHATDKVQRDIEDVLFRHGLYYERRKNYYANQGHRPSEIVTPLYAGAGYVALVMKAPHRAAALRSKFMRSAESYEAVFNSNAPLEVWPKIVAVLKQVDAGLERLRPTGKSTDRFLKGWRYIIGFLVVSESLGRFTYSPLDLARFDVSQVTPGAVEQVWTELSKYDGLRDARAGWTSFSNVLRACRDFAAKRGIAGGEALIPVLLASDRLARNGAVRSPTSEFIEQVRVALPPQPWKPGTSRRIIEQLGCAPADYSAAVERLVEDGAILRQKDGVLYDLYGSVVTFDPDRVDPETLKLLNDQGQDL